MKHLYKLFFLLLLISCGSSDPGQSSYSEIPAAEDINVLPAPIPDVFTIQDILIYDPLSGFSDEYKEECIRQVYLRCPPYDEYWIAEAWIDICDNYNIILIKNCRWQHECDPTDPIIEEDQPCQMGDGSPGIQTVYCDKGKITLTECNPCTDEVCDGIDNDCDGDIDEGEYECETECGPGAAYCVDGQLVCEAEQPEEEVCDYIDNDCDGLIDEGQRNACDTCGALPTEICNGIDDDCNGDTDENLFHDCTTVCEPGYETCIFGQWALCTAQQPVPEVCNGEDDDCNGLIDDGIDCQCQLQDIGMLVPCFEPPLICGQGYKSCECAPPDCSELYMTECAAACILFGFIPCDPEKGQIFPEICNNWDDNCNFLIDEDLHKICYSGPPETLGVGECAAGQLTCAAGQWGAFTPTNLFIEDFCLGEVIPKPEICNGKDDDCDGVIEEQLTETDIVFIIDSSGSMVDEIETVINALSAFSLSYSDEPNINWALVIGPYRLSVPGAGAKDLLRLKTNLSPFSAFLASLQDFYNNTPLNGSYEPLYDAVYLIISNLVDSSAIQYSESNLVWRSTNSSDPPITSFDINWREDAHKVVVVFTDEPGQSWLRVSDGNGGYTEDEIYQQNLINAINGVEDLKVFVFSPESTKNSTKNKYSNGTSTQIGTGWQPITLAGEVGEWYELTTDSTEMFNNLMQVLEDTACFVPTE